MSVNEEIPEKLPAEPSTSVDLAKRAPAGAPSLAIDGPEGSGDGADGADGADSADDDGGDDKKPKHSASRTILEWILVVGGAVLIALVVKTFLFQAFYIPTGSMEPTLNVGDRILVNKASYKLHDVHRGDIIVFERPANASTGTIEDLIKRVVALPGETIEVRQGKVFIDGKALPEPYLPEGMVTPPFPKTTVPPDRLFVLGDNRGDSQASNVFGPIDQDLIVGRAFVRVWPLGDLGGI